MIAKTLGPAVREAAAQVPEMDSETAAMAGMISQMVLKALYAGLVLLLAASIGLLKRKNWGRLLRPYATIRESEKIEGSMSGAEIVRLRTRGRWRDAEGAI